MTTPALSPKPVGLTPRRRTFLIVLSAVGLFVVTYIAAWLSAYNLAQSYLVDADASFADGEYLEALTGYDEFDDALGRNVFRGGYQQVVNIWSSPYAQPVPEAITPARSRIDEIINQHITIDDAEGFVQRNVGRSNPFLGRIFLRLGELYEAEGDVDDAMDIYEEVAELFPREPDLIARAAEHLKRLETAEN